MSKQYPGGIISKTPPAPSGPYANSTAPGVWTLEQQAYWQKLGQWPTQGNVDPSNIYIEYLFNTYLVLGDGTAPSVNNGINVSGQGGLVWTKKRSASGSNSLFDTARGANLRLISNDTAAEDSVNLNFTTTGFSNYTFDNAVTYVAWTFRKQAKFFDIVTWTGDGTAPRTINHNLGSTPGCIIVKRVSGGFGEDWHVFHRSLTAGQNLVLNSTATPGSGSIGSPTSTTFTISSAASGNSSGYPYVAYLFAHDAGGFGLSGTENIISCGSFTTDAVGWASTTLNYEPQWLLYKNITNADDWYITDISRGQSTGSTSSVNNDPNTNTVWLKPNSSAAEVTNFETYAAKTQSQGFTYVGGGGTSASSTYVYIAIRRGPMAVPTVGTSVFYPNAVAQADFPISSNVPFQPDLVNTFSRNGTQRTSVYSAFIYVDRVRGLGVPNNAYSKGGPTLQATSTDAEITTAGGGYVQLRADGQNITRGNGWNAADYGNWIYYFMRRAPSFMDVVCYTGTGVARTVAHNLTVAPELMIVKSRSSGVYDWRAYSSTIGATKYLKPNGDSSEATSSAVWNDTTPTSSVFTVGSNATVNVSTGIYVAYLFATCAGVSKVGSYTGTGAAQTINCGFTSGSRFVMIKRTDSTGDWYVWDSARGIIPSNDPYLLMNSTAAEVTGTDYVDTTSVGFDVTSTAPAAINANGGTFIFLAIA
tara:strand:- start:559 stop:2661 length:2103 start_codon:yes stop_codon:yes gene_type:complete